MGNLAPQNLPLLGQRGYELQQRLFQNLYPDHHVWLCLLGEDPQRMQRFLVGGDGAKYPLTLGVTERGSSRL